MEKYGEICKKVIDGEAITITADIEAMLEKCPRFRMCVENKLKRLKNSLLDLLLTHNEALTLS